MFHYELVLRNINKNWTNIGFILLLKYFLSKYTSQHNEHGKSNKVLCSQNLSDVQRHHTIDYND